MAFNLTMGQYAIGIIGTLGSWFLIGCLGRRTIYLSGGLVLFFLLLVVGFLSLLPESNLPSRWAIGSVLLVYTFIYDLTIGPVCYAIIAEISSTRLKSKTIVIARMTYIVGSIVSNFLTNYQLTPRPTGWEWGAKSAFFWAGSCGVCCVWVWGRLPETRGRTCGEMDGLFECKVGAREFGAMRVEDLGLDAASRTGVEREGDGGTKEGHVIKEVEKV